MENKSSTGRPKAPIMFRPRKKDTFQIAANYMNYNWHSSDKNSWILATKVRMNTNATQYRQHEETIDYWSNEGQDYISKVQGQQTQTYFLQEQDIIRLMNAPITCTTDY